MNLIQSIKILEIIYTLIGHYSETIRYENIEELMKSFPHTILHYFGGGFNLLKSVTTFYENPSIETLENIQRAIVAFWHPKKVKIISILTPFLEIYWRGEEN